MVLPSAARAPDRYPWREVRVQRLGGHLLSWSS